MKADQWRNLINVLPVALYCAWEVNGEIPDADAPRPKKSTKAAKVVAQKEKLLAQRRRTDRACNRQATVANLEEFENEDSSDEEPTEMSRNYRNHYDCVLNHASAIRIYASRSITPNEVVRAGQSHSRACRAWARMNCHLTPNFHLSEHNPQFFLVFGPVYGYWGFPMEQHNGFLKKFNHNGHTGGELEATLMRGWLKYSLVSDLVSFYCMRVE